MTRLLSSRLVWHGNWYKGHGKVWVTKGTFQLLETLFFFRKYLVILLPYWKITLFLTSHSSLGLFYYAYPLLTRDKFVCIITHLVLLYFLFEKVCLKQTKPFAAFTLLFATSVQCWHTPQILHHMHWPSFPFDSKYNINNLDTLAKLKICFGQQLLTCKWFLRRSCSHTDNNVPAKR